MIGRILKITRSLVRSVVNNIRRYMNQVEGEVANPLRNITGEITGGVWKGQGADRFVEWMNSQIIPMLLSIIGLNMSWGDTLLRSLDRMDEAEQTAMSLVQPLFDQFNFF